MMELLVSLPKRGIDSYGSGAYKARRSHGRQHNAVDYACPPGYILKSPLTGDITKIGYCYDDDLSYRYVEITTKSGEYRHRFFYIKPMIKLGHHVYKGETIGRVDDIRRRYPRDSRHEGPILNHIHYEVIDLNGEFVNPETL